MVHAEALMSLWVNDDPADIVTVTLTEVSPVSACAETVATATFDAPELLSVSFVPMESFAAFAADSELTVNEVVLAVMSDGAEGTNADGRAVEL